MTPENQLNREHAFQSEVLHAIGRIKLIALGKMPRGRRKNHRDWEVGTRPMKMADAKAVAALAVDRLSLAVNAFLSSAPRPNIVFETQFVSVHREPSGLGPLESCTDCRRPTPYWMQDQHTPLCPDCCTKRNAVLQNESRTDQIKPAP